MKTDLYTKSVLTVIAGALAIIAIQQAEIVPAANASKPGNGFVTVPVNPDGSINVKIVENMKVDISAIGGSSVYGALPVNLKEMGGSSISSSYGLPVNIEAVNGSSIYDALPVKMK